MAAGARVSKAPPPPSAGRLVALAPAFDLLIASNTPIERVAEGFKSATAPCWDSSERQLLFSDIESNRLYAWQSGAPARVVLEMSGYTNYYPRGGAMGTSAILVESARSWILCQHGNRRIERIEIRRDETNRTVLVEYYRYSRFNSPHAAVMNRNGDLYFTDPPLGLEGLERDSSRELTYSGVYQLPRKGELRLLDRELARPTGIALSPSEKSLYVADANPQRPAWWAYELGRDGSVGARRLWFDGASLSGQGRGLPGGMRTDQKGNVFAAGPGGILVLSASGQHLGTIEIPEPVSGCAWGDNGARLYVTGAGAIYRIATRTKGRIR